ncbi:hypothetical protein MUK42_33040 [Musa troglodytarum]|uniref:Uncharacterized protein n=1 Tax=Musa troglodytarum TaxID=320322 RepID=A0A9E7LFZ0_9LILI|nr:hypothetical protein MUK42_33040 [Musa troglodytarum]
MTRILYSSLASKDAAEEWLSSGASWLLHPQIELRESVLHEVDSSRRVLINAVVPRRKRVFGYGAVVGMSTSAKVYNPANDPHGMHQRCGMVCERVHAASGDVHGFPQ